MASNPDFVQYVADQCADAGEIITKKMFGDYGIYCDSKIFGLICDNRFYIKPTEAGRKLLRTEQLQPPYKAMKSKKQRWATSSKDEVTNRNNDTSNHIHTIRHNVQRNTACTHKTP